MIFTLDRLVSVHALSLKQDTLLACIAITTGSSFKLLSFRGINFTTGVK